MCFFSQSIYKEASYYNKTGRSAYRRWDKAYTLLAPGAKAWHGRRPSMSIENSRSQIVGRNFEGGAKLFRYVNYGGDYKKALRAAEAWVAKEVKRLGF